MAERQYFAEGVLIQETGERQYFAEGVLIQETVTADSGVSIPVLQAYYRQQHRTY